MSLEARMVLNIGVMRSLTNEMNYKMKSRTYSRIGSVSSSLPLSSLLFRFLFCLVQD